MWFTAARSNTYSPSPARLAPGVRATCCDIFCLLRFPLLSSTKRVSTASGERPRLVASRAEQRPRPSAENDRLIGGRNRQAANLRHALRHAHVEGIVAAEQHAVGARIADEEFKHLFRVHDGIEIEALERIRRRFPKLALRLCAHVPTVHETPGLVGHESTAMGEANLQRGMALEHAAEHETCGSD